MVYRYCINYKIRFPAINRNGQDVTLVESLIFNLRHFLVLYYFFNAVYY